MIFCVEKDTSLLYEVQFFDTFVMIRPATPGMEAAIDRMDHLQYEARFREFHGDPERVFNENEEGPQGVTVD